MFKCNSSDGTALSIFDDSVARVMVPTAGESVSVPLGMFQSSVTGPLVPSKQIDGSLQQI